MFITSDKFREIIKLVPLVSIDLLIENENGEYLFGLRNNRPAKNYFLFQVVGFAKMNLLKMLLKEYHLWN
ncbi:GDP-mannose mannosyl hydrolase [Escherichia coli DEC8B]|nr:GDP-mannose mannosyl hydrolase [Escherichia coli DEC8B]EIL22148.1 putative GDP-mannose mannosylhydrolase [Escherichia coli O111:H8 str. CVM9574]